MESPGKKPLIVFFCATYLKPEMQHIYRQITSLNHFSRLVVTQKIENLTSFPFEPIMKVKRSPWRWWQRFQERSFNGAPWQFSQRETSQMLSLLEKYNASILHIFFGTVAIHLLPLLRQCPIPVVVSFHGADVAGIMLSPTYQKPLLEIFEKATLLTCRSSNLAENLKYLGCSQKKIQVQHTILPDLPFSQHIPPQDGKWKILQASRLIPKKGLRTSLQAFALFIQKCPASLTIAGEGPMEKELQELARQLNIASHVHFVGFKNQTTLRQLFTSHSIFIHPSESTSDGDREGIPNVLLEAIAAGLPSIATWHGGIPEVIQNGKDGLLVRERHPEELAQAMLLLSQDADLYCKISNLGSKNVKKKFGKSSSQLAEIYQNLLKDNFENFNQL